MSYEVLHAIERGCSAFGSPAVAILLGVAAYRFNRLQTQLAAGQAKTAQYQAGLAAEKLRRDLYDRRYAILEAAQRLLWLPHGFPNPKDPEVQGKFSEANAVLQHGRFLLDLELYGYLAEQTKTVFRLIENVKLVQDLSYYGGDKQAQAEALMRHTKEVSGLIAVMEDLPRRFEPYLRLKDAGPLDGSTPVAKAWLNI